MIKIYLNNFKVFGIKRKGGGDEGVRYWTPGRNDTLQVQTLIY